MENQNYSQLMERLMGLVEKPARYAGGEWNTVVKDWDKELTKVVFAFPDVYEVGMSHLGLQILYNTINSRPDALLERVFSPWHDMEKLMRESSLPLLSLESRKPVRNFDILGFTLQYEMSFTNILNILDLSGIPMYSKNRKKGDTLVIAGGPCAFNPEPLADFIDAFAIGEGEDVFQDILEVYKENKDKERAVMLRNLAAIPGVYVPQLYRVDYRADGSIFSFNPIDTEIPRKIKKRIIADLDQVEYPLNPIVPNMGIIHDRIMLEVMRGCTRGCRFCQAGMIYRPVREKKADTLAKQGVKLVNNTGYDEVSLVSLSSADYSQLRPLIKELLDSFEDQGVGVSLPSLRVDSFSVDLAKEVQRVRRSSLTFAPEAGTQRLRDVINKGVVQDDLLDAVSAAFNSGWHGIKLYFMIGLPTEEDADIEGIVALARLVLKNGLDQVKNKGKLKITISASSFVPKSHTPFQWEPMNTLEQIKDKQQHLKSLFKDKKISFKWHEPEVSFLEGVFARGDRRLSGVLENAWRMGCRFDGWSEYFNYEIWKKAFEISGLDPSWYAYRSYNYEDILPWDHIDSGVCKDFLIEEHRSALEATTTPDCRNDQCSVCGVCGDAGFKPIILDQGSDACASIQD
ncbi:MAG: TIGR03960 family B12-binding radical SAM protein [Peptococcaceae bacterium]|nr:TIGR03960 family B12-binding radical SAM protein [Peptococcaceae bacterium]